MSLITDSHALPLQNAYANAGTYKFSRESNKAVAVENMRGDTVEISGEAKLMAERQGSLMNPAKELLAGSEEHKAFIELKEKVKKGKSDVTSRIEAAAKKAGIRLADLGKAKIEVDSAGKVLVGGLSDKNAARQLEKALNDDKGLATAIKDYQENEREFSRQVKDYTGCSLYELTMTSRGDVNARIRSELEQDGKYQFDADYYLNLAFLGSATDFLSLDDVSSLSFSGNVDFSAEVNLMADPEGSIKETMDGMFASIQAAFDEINAEIMKELKAQGLEDDKEAIAARMLNARNAVITIDSDGGVEISGELATDPDSQSRGMKALEEIARKVLVDTENNSYHVNIFMAASQNIINRDSESGYGKVVARMAHGRVQDIRLDTPRSTGGAYAALKDSVAKAMAGVLR